MEPFDAILFLGAVGLVLLLPLALSRTVKRSLRCPATGREATVHLQQLIWCGQFLDVKRCSTFEPPDAITCDRACICSGQPLWRTSSARLGGPTG